MPRTRRIFESNAVYKISFRANDSEGIAATIGRYSHLLGSVEGRMPLTRLEIHHLEGQYHSASPDLQFQKIGEEHLSDRTVAILAEAIRHSSHNQKALEDFASIQSLIDGMLARRLGLADDAEYRLLRRADWERATVASLNTEEDREVTRFLNNRTGALAARRLPIEEYCYDYRSDSFPPKFSFLPGDILEQIPVSDEVTELRRTLKVLYRKVGECRLKRKDDAGFLELANTLHRTIEVIPTEVLHYPGLLARATVLLQRTLELVVLRKDEQVDRSVMNRKMGEQLTRF
jgi:hypothetical protein